MYTNCMRKSLLAADIGLMVYRKIINILSFTFFRSVTGCFIDNHDHFRFLFKNPSYVALRNNLVYVFMSQCIPILYYGTEQGFNGGDDPNNRESLWPYLNQTHELYTFIKRLLQIRRSLASKWLKTAQIERDVSFKIYSFSRGGILMVITTESKTISTQIKSHPYKSGQVLQNLLNTMQAFSVSATGELKVVLKDGEPLILATNSAGGAGLWLGFSYFSIIVVSLICQL